VRFTALNFCGSCNINQHFNYLFGAGHGVSGENTRGGISSFTGFGDDTPRDDIMPRINLRTRNNIIRRFSVQISFPARADRQKSPALQLT
jgi:hypothetical protein